MATAFTYEVLLQHDNEPVPYSSGIFVRVDPYFLARNRDPLRFMDDASIIRLLKTKRKDGVVQPGVISARARFAWYKVERNRGHVVVVRSVREPLRAILRPLEVVP